MIDEILENFGSWFIHRVISDNQPFTAMEHVGPDGEIWHESHPFFDLESEYEKWKEIIEIKKAVSEMLD